MSVGASTYPAKTVSEVRPSATALRLRRWLGPDWRLGFLFVLPIVVLVLALVAYPFCYAIYLSMTRKFVGMPPVFVGLENYIRLASDGFFQRAVWNSVIFTFGSVIFKLVLAWRWRWCSPRRSASATCSPGSC